MNEFKPLSDTQWFAIESLFPAPIKRGRGKPHSPWRSVVNTVLYIYVTGSKWASVPKGSEWASKSASHRWMKEWEKTGLLSQIISTLKAKTPQQAERIAIMPYEQEPIYAELQAL